MLTIILALIASLVVAYLATQNASLVSLQLGAMTLSQIPLFFVVLASILVGVLVASVVTVLNLIKSTLKISGQKSELKKSYNTVGELKGRVSELEEENKILKEQIHQLAPSTKAMVE